MNLTDDEGDVPGAKIDVKLDKLFFIDKDFWSKEADDIEKYFQDQVGSDLPPAMNAEVLGLRQRVKDYHEHWRPEGV